MSSVRKFLFDESFDVDIHGNLLPSAVEEDIPEPEPEPVPEEPPPPVFSESELMAAQARGYAEGEQAGRSAGYGQGFAEGHAAGRNDGMQAGREEMESTVAARIAGALERVAGGVGALLAEREASAAARRDEPVHVALAIVRKLFPELSRRGALTEVEGIVRGCLIELTDEPRLVVRVADDVQDAVREHLDAAIASRGFGAKLMVVGDPSLAPGDCRVEWAEGGAERDTRQLLAEIEQCVGRLLEAPVPA